MTPPASTSGETPELSERLLKHWHRFGAGLPKDANHTPLSACVLAGNGTFQTSVDRVEALFTEGDSHRISFRLPEVHLANGVSVRIRLGGWTSIRYLAFGYTCNGVFRHIKVPNPAQSRWFDITIGHGDIGFGLQNNWEHPAAAMVGDIRIDVRGRPSADGARVDIRSLLCWEEESVVPHRPATCTRPSILPPRTPPPAGWLEAVHAYMAKMLPAADDQARDFMASGECPLISGALLPWPPDASVPADLADVNTHVFSWHALHSATILMLHARNAGREGAVYAARDLVSQWLERSYFMPDTDKKYAWYEHGVADRMLALLLMWAEGLGRDFDHRFMTRVGEAIVRHAQLLESELFYVSHQRIRHHNHAWFQDTALLAAAAAFPAHPSAARWRDRALERLDEQAEMLVVRDAGFAVSIENSPNYHRCLETVGEFAGALARLAGGTTVVAEVAKELTAFSNLLRYPDGTEPAQGDSFRVPREPTMSPRHESAAVHPACVVLPRAGYGIARGEHDGVPFMLCVFATSLSSTHKHADDLSFTLFFDGIEWLIDPSYYSHEYRLPLPAYLRSAAAHNAIDLPDVPYSIEPGGARLSGGGEGDRFHFDGTHTCYPDTTVTRTVEGVTTELALSFTDGIWGPDGEGDAFLMLQCGDGVTATRNGAVVTLSNPRSRFHLAVAMPTDRIDLAVGQESGPRIRGISGTSFLQKVPICTIECRVPKNQPLRWTIRAAAS